jgi:hypothetical protein
MGIFLPGVSSAAPFWTTDMVLRIWALVVSTWAVIVATGGLYTWRRQLFGQVKFDHARRLALAAYKVRDEILYSRIAVSETNSSEILSTISKAFSAFNVEILEAEVVFGKPVTELRKPLWLCFSEFGRNVHRMLRLAERMRHDTNFADEYYKVETAVVGNDDDEFAQALFGAVAKVEDFLRPWLPARRHRPKNAASNS